MKKINILADKKIYNVILSNFVEVIRK